MTHRSLTNTPIDIRTRLLEKALIEYAEKYGLTDKARRALSDKAEALPHTKAKVGSVDGVAAPYCETI